MLEYPWFENFLPGLYMEQTRKNPLMEIDLPCLMWCFCLPVFTFVIAIVLAVVFADTRIGGSLTNESLRRFLDYYDRHQVTEFIVILLNNYIAVLLLVYFTPIALGLKDGWGKWRNKKAGISVFEKILLYLFPGLFLMRQAINIAIIIKDLSGIINKNIVITLAGIILPHGLPELLAFSLAGAIGMGVTRKLLFTPVSGRLVGGKALGILLIFIASCAFLEVYLTPRVFAAIMVATGVS